MNGTNDFIQIGIDYSGNEDKHCAVLNLYYNNTHHMIYETFDKEQIKALDNVLHNTFEQQVKAMAWDIVAKKNVDLRTLKSCFNTPAGLKEYNKHQREENELTEEEFNLLKECLE